MISVRCQTDVHAQDEDAVASPPTDLLMKSPAFAAAALIALAAPMMMLLPGCSTTPHSRTVGTVIDDVTLTTRVKAALLAEPDVKSLDIGVQTFSGTVQLSGFVDSEWQIEKATEVARRIEGVQQVRNNLVHKAP